MVFPFEVSPVPLTIFCNAEVNDPSDAPISRDPDFKKPSGEYQQLAAPLIKLNHALVSPNALFAYKAGVLSTLAAFPAFFHNTADYYYKHRGEELSHESYMLSTDALLRQESGW